MFKRLFILSGILLSVFSAENAITQDNKSSTSTISISEGQQIIIELEGEILLTNAYDKNYEVMSEIDFEGGVWGYSNHKKVRIAGVDISEINDKIFKNKRSCN